MSNSITEEKLEAYSGKYEGSYAYITIKDRLPVILTKAIDSLCRDKHNIGTQYGEIAKEETKLVIGHLSELQNEMVTNKPIIPLVSDAEDIKIWNEYLEREIQRSNFIPAWFDSTWLYVECYLYRRIKQAFELSTSLKEYDPFAKLKETALLSSLNAACLIAQSLENILLEYEASNNSSIYQNFTAFLEISLWGNKCDLSLSAGEQLEVSRSPVDQLQEWKQNIICNETESIWKILQEANKATPGKVRIDLVLDNAGFELFSDLSFLHYLCSTNLVSTVHIYVKLIPWFVSDTLEKDIHWLLDALLRSNEPLLVKYSKIWAENITNKRWIIEKEMFWTLPHPFFEMKSADPQLYSKLSQSDLVIFKGDLNYRKLLGDVMWDETVPFVTSLREFVPSSVAAIRTIKADCMSGLKPGIVEELNKLSNNWKFSGNYAVIQCTQKI